MGNTCFSGGTQKKAKNTWLAGKVKCGVCGAGLMSMPAANKATYFRCRKRADSKSCEGCGTLRVFDVEQFIYEKLLDTLSGANQTLLSYANAKIEGLDTRRQDIIKAIADMSAEAVSPEHMKRISGHLSNWESADFEDRRLVADGLISKIHATCDSMRIEWKI